MPAFDYHRPTTLKEAWRLAGELPSHRFVAGGTDVMVRIREGAMRPEALISLGAIAELGSIQVGEQVRLGAGVRIAALLEHDELRQAVPVLGEAARTLGSTQIRNLATVGGNLCNASPCADTAPPLLVYEARARIASADGERELPLEELFLAPGETRLAKGEVLRELVFERRPKARAAFVKKGRVRMDIALASVAVLLELDGTRCSHARVAAGSLGPRPLRLREVEAVLEGAELDEATLDKAAAAASAAVTPISDVRASASYRRHLAGALTRRALGRVLNGGES